MSPPTSPPGGAPSSGEAPLPCGTDPGALLAQVTGGRGNEHDRHQTECPHCRATLAEYARLWAPFDQLAAIPSPAPSAVMDRALAAIGHRAGPTGWGRVEDPGGPFTVAARAVVAVAGHAARTSPRVRMALGSLGRSVPGDGSPGAVHAGVSGRSVAVELTVAAEYGHDLYALADTVRSRVAHEVAAQTGLEVVTVDVTVTDVFAPRAGHRAT